jgi:dihydrodiol dehydrogenase / D-xylose 1-dehydrogenase (NADP)
MLCLEAGKNVLCEKAFTVNAPQARALADKAKEKGLFLMEGLWTRYFPLSTYVRQVVSSGLIGPVERVLSEHSLPYAGIFEDENHIMINPRLAGGILLDAGIYSLTWTFRRYTALSLPVPESALSSSQLLRDMRQLALIPWSPCCWNSPGMLNTAVPPTL